MEWKTLAMNLPMGHKTRSNCECGEGNTLIINHNTKAYSCHCFRCDFHDYESKGKQSLAELAHIAELNRLAETIELKLELPDDYTRELPLEGRLWLYKAGITEPTWRHFGIGYSESLKRVIIPVYDEAGELIWFQCRAIYKGQKPKYIQPKMSRERVFFRGRVDDKDTTRIAVVEDMLSAIRVSKQYNVISLLGTKITNFQANWLARYDTVLIWLDPDRAGVKGAYSIRKTLGLVTETRIIRSDKDPKELTDKEIGELLCYNDRH